jgi:Mor family transcriptional regulator
MPYPEFMEQLARLATEVAMENGLPAAHAAKIGVAVAERARAEWGGQQIYIARPTVGLERRNADIAARAAAGATAPELAARFGLTQQTVYRILRSRRHTDP